MAKYKITIVDQQLGKPVSEIIESAYPPAIQMPLHSLSNGMFGMFIRMELLLESAPEDTYDNTGNS